MIFTSDNGVSMRFATHDSISPGFIDGTLLKGQKADIFEGGHRVPYIVSWPGHVAKNTTSDALVELNDIYATLSDIVQQPLRVGMAEDSVSMLPILTGKGSESGTARRYSVNHSLSGGFAIREIDDDGNEWKLVFGMGAGGGFSGGRTTDPFTSMTMFDMGLGEFQLYNLSSDPGEDNNLLIGDVSPEEYEISRRLQDRLLGYITSGRSRLGSD